MKKVLTILGLIFCIAGPVHADDVKMSGAVEIQYRSSSDKYKNNGGDQFQPNELYLQVSRELDKNIIGLIKLDGADMNTGSASHKYVEEAQVIFKDIGSSPVTIVAGKDEMPFGQDYEQFLFNSLTHEFEIDKVWGLHGIAKIGGFGSFAAAVFQRDPADKKDVALTDSYTASLKMDKLVNHLSVEASYAKIGKDDLVVTEEDEKRLSVGAKFSIAGLTLHAEHTAFTNYNNTDKADPSVTQVGADYRIGDFLIKARHEAIDNDDLGGLTATGKFDAQDSQSAVGVSYYITPKAFIALEYETVKYDTNLDPTKDDTKEVLLGAVVKY